ncbi:MAG: biotin--[acetyl-CoA-carboxylase] ligase [Pseudomonadota bacterium]|nr:biotin--[acetyl-CoA-carboxylase] ligase [Pseudomonadota bacterium]
MNTRQITLQQRLAQYTLHPPQVIWLDSIDSTNQALQRREIAVSESLLIIADQQTQGRGQAGRQWQSPTGNLYLSVCLPIHRPLQGRMALEVALAVLDTPLLNAAMGLGIKWPNDLYHHQAGRLSKWGGILVESKSPQQVLIGLGINLQAMQTYVHDQTVSDLSSILQHQIDPISLITQLYVALSRAVQQFDQGSLELPARFSRYDLLANQSVQITLPSQRMLIGRADGIAQDGAFRIVTAHGTEQIYSGQVRRIDQGS